MSDADRIRELEAKVKTLQESLSKVGQPKKSPTHQKFANIDTLKQTAGQGEKKPVVAKVRQGPIDLESGSSNKQHEKPAHSTNEKSSGASNNAHDETKQSQSSGDYVQKVASATKKESARHAARAIFDHLPVQKPPPPSGDVDGDKLLHLSILKLGAMYRSGLVQEDDDRVAALLCAFCNIIQDYKTPPHKSLSWDLDKYMRLQVQYLVDCRVHCVGMGNLIKQLRYFISKVPPEMSEADAKKMILGKLHTFLEDSIAGGESIGKLVTRVIHHNDVILTFGSTPLLRKVLIAAAAKKKFRLIVVDARPLNNGLKTLRACSPYIDCVYTPLSGAAKVMGDVTRVILGASAMLSNGSMLAAAGNAVVASLAKYRHVPVIALCESYKFSERVQLDSIVHNELGNVREIALADAETGSVPQLNPGYYGAAINADNDTLPFSVVNLRYDCTPIGNISAVATGTGIIPPTSVPVLIRELRTELERNSV